MMRSTVLLVALIMLVTWGQRVAAASLPEGKKTISLIAADGSKLPIGQVTFTGDAAGATITVKIDAPEFGDEFLSMRPFRCLPDPKEMWCHLEYPYSNAKHISQTWSMRCCSCSNRRMALGLTRGMGSTSR
jgi:hypothetical protein